MVSIENAHNLCSNLKQELGSLYIGHLNTLSALTINHFILHDRINQDILLFNESSKNLDNTSLPFKNKRINIGVSNVRDDYILSFINKCDTVEVIFTDSRSSWSIQSNVVTEPRKCRVHTIAPVEFEYISQYVANFCSKNNKITIQYNMHFPDQRVNLGCDGLPIFYSVEWIDGKIIYDSRVDPCRQLFNCNVHEKH